jgi:glucosamine 6-phosphate synthetase-like amidotransferase/phosphosugar isomerase protein
MPFKAIDKTQIRLIHVAKSQLKIGEENYREMLRAWYGVESSKALTYDQASALIDELKRIGFRLKTKRVASPCAMCATYERREKLPDDVIVLASREQLLKIGHLREDVQWKAWDGYVRWLRKYFGIRQVRTSPEASAVIEGLKGLLMSQKRCTCAIAKRATHGTPIEENAHPHREEHDDYTTGL